MITAKTIFLPQIKRSLATEELLSPAEVFDHFRSEFEAVGISDALATTMNNHPWALQRPIVESCRLTFSDYSSEEGSRAYIRTLALLLTAAARELKLPTLKIEFALAKGYYGTIGDRRPTTEELSRVRAYVQRLIDEDLPIQRTRLFAEEAIQYMEELGDVDTAALINDSGRYSVVLWELKGSYYYILHQVLSRTGQIHLFDLEPANDGFLIRVPDRSDPTTLAERELQPKLFKALDSQHRLITGLSVEDVTPLKLLIRSGRTTQMIQVAEAQQEKQIAAIASHTARLHRDKGVSAVLISGPSSSGKTTFSRRLTTQLLTHLIRPYPISLDDFYVNRAITPHNEAGQPDYESVYALDLPFLRETLKGLVRGEEMPMPRYDFTLGQRVMDSRNNLRLSEQDMIIIEGIHGLNPIILTDAVEASSYKIYVSALTAISYDKHNWLSTSDNRLLRRMVRDVKYRNKPPEETLTFWADVRAGEEKWVFPYQEEADVIFNSAMVYELGALRQQAELAISRVPEMSPVYPVAARLLRELRFFDPIPEELLPHGSLLREFIGGSSYRDW